MLMTGAIGGMHQVDVVFCAVLRRSVSWRACLKARSAALMGVVVQMWLEDTIYWAWNGKRDSFLFRGVGNVLKRKGLLFDFL